MKRFGKTRTKLAIVLGTKLRESENLPRLSIEPEDFWIQQGAYRHATWDLARWGVDIHCEGGKYLKVYSWDTMTDCVRYGITILSQENRDIYEREISSNKP